MRFAEKELQLYDGKTCTLRSLMPQDAAALIGQLRLVSEETRFMLREPEEITITVEQEQAVLQNVLELSDSIMLGGFLDGRMIANSGFSPVSSYSRLRHRASVGVSVVRGCWNMGIGKAMLTELIGLAKQAGYEQLEISITGGNNRASALYRTLGFVECGNIPNAFRYRDGSYAAEILMIRKLDG